MVGTRAMNFYCYRHSHPLRPGRLKRQGSSFSSGLSSGTGMGTIGSSSDTISGSVWNSNSSIYSLGSNTLDFWTRSPLWIHLLFLLILLPSPGTQQQQSIPTAGSMLLKLSSNSSNNGNLGESLTNRSSVNGTGSLSNVNITGGSDALGDDNPFENNTYSNTTVPIGDTAFLKCTIRNLGERSVSWIRRRDMHIISVGKVPYTNDERFHVLNSEGSDDWVLQIKYVQKRDNGTYECQVSTGKGIASYAVHLFVAVPEAFILGNGEYHIQEGSTLNLVCIVEKSPKPPDYIFWYQNDRMINYDKDPNLRIQTETGSKTHSRLIIDNAQVNRSGNYTCHIANADPASTLVYISQGDKMAAIQRRKSSATRFSSLTSYVPIHELIPILLLSFLA